MDTYREEEEEEEDEEVEGSEELLDPMPVLVLVVLTLEDDDTIEEVVGGEGGEEREMPVVLPPLFLPVSDEVSLEDEVEGVEEPLDKNEVAPFNDSELGMLMFMFIFMFMCIPIFMFMDGADGSFRFDSFLNIFPVPVFPSLDRASRASHSRMVLSASNNDFWSINSLLGGTSE